MHMTLIMSQMPMRILERLLAQILIDPTDKALDYLFCLAHCAWPAKSTYVIFLLQHKLNLQ